jgi:predicted PurR-regulated permease PerM
MFGLIGLVLGPLVFAFLLAMLRIYERDFHAETATAPPARV